MKCDKCGTELRTRPRDGAVVEAMAEYACGEEHTRERCLSAQLASARAIIADFERIGCSHCMSRSHTTAEHDDAAGAGVSVVGHLRAQLAAERERRQREGDEADMLWQSKVHTALAAQKAAEERAERAEAELYAARVFNLGWTQEIRDEFYAQVARERDAALAAQKAAEERAEQLDARLAASRHFVAHLERMLKTAKRLWENGEGFVLGDVLTNGVADCARGDWKMASPQAPAAEPEGSGK